MPPVQPTPIVDVRGRAIDTRLPAQRVVSLVPSDTYSLFAIGAGERLVGRTQFCVHPEEALEGIPKIGGTKTPKIQAILDLEPDLILANREENRLEDIHALEEAGARVFVSQPGRVADSPALVRDLGAMCHLSQAAEDIARGIEGEITLCESDHKSAPIPCLYFIWRRPYMGVGSDTYIFNSLRLVGFEPLAPEGALRYPELDEAFIQSSKAKACLFPSEPFLFRERHVEAFALAFPGLPAVKSRALPLISGEDPSWHGAWALRGLPALRRLSSKIRSSITQVSPAP